MRRRRPVGCLVTQDTDIGFGISKRFERRHLDVVAGRRIIGTIPTMPDDRTRVGENPVGMLDPLDRIADRLSVAVIVIRQTIYLRE